MLRSVATDNPSRYREVPRRAVELLCDDGAWHPGVVHAEQVGPYGWEVLVYSGGHHFGTWLVYSRAAMRAV
jgi:hypothetical protein